MEYTRIAILEPDEKHTQAIIDGLDCPECEIVSFREVWDFVKAAEADSSKLPHVLIMNFNLNSDFSTKNIIEHYEGKIPVIIVLSRKYDRDTRELCYHSGATDVIREDNIGEIIRATRNLWRHRQTVAINQGESAFLN